MFWIQTDIFTYLIVGVFPLRLNLSVPGQTTAEATTKHGNKMSNSFPVKKKKKKIEKKETKSATTKDRASRHK